MILLKHIDSRIAELKLNLESNDSDDIEKLKAYNLEVLSILEEIISHLKFQKIFSREIN